MVTELIAATGPHRDLVGDLTKSVRAAGLHMGLYHSIFEWYNALYLQDKANNYTTSLYVDQVYLPEAKEINNLCVSPLLVHACSWSGQRLYCSCGWAGVLA